MQDKKIGNFTAVALIISSMIGAGIFIKTKTLNKLSHNETAPIVILLLMGIFLVISLLMSLSLISSKQLTSHGYLEWTKNYCPKWIHVSSINYTRFIYQPLSFLLLGIYVVELIKEESQFSTWNTIALSAFIVLIFLFINLMSFSLAKKIQITLLCVVLMSLIILPIIGLIDGINSSYAKESYIQTIKMQNSAKGLNSFGPWMILLSGLPSVFFMYDGFYSTLSLRHKLKKPQKLTSCLIVAFIIVTFLYIYLIISFKIGAPNSGNFNDFPTIKKYPVLKNFFNITIAGAALLTLNNAAMSGSNQLIALNEKYKFKDIEFLKSLIFYKSDEKNKKFEYECVTWIYIVIKIFIWYWIIGLISVIVDYMSGSPENILKINDALADVTSSLIFAIIAISILYLNKDLKNNEKIKNRKLYRYAAIFASNIIFLALTYMYLNFFVGMLGFKGSNKFLCAFKLFLSVLFIVISAYPFIYDKIIYLKNKNWYKMLKL